MKRMKQIERRVSRSTASTNKAANWGNYVFKKDVYEVFVPFSQGNIVFKLLPGLNPDDAGETTDPMLLDNGDWGSWQTSVRIVSCGDGDKRVQYCDQVDYWDPVSSDSTPYGLAYNMCKRMETADEFQRISDWVALTKNGNATRPATMPKVSERTYAFCVPYWTHKGVYDHNLTKQKLHVICLKKLASESLFDLCEKCCRKDPPIDLTDAKTGPFISMWSGAATNPYTGEAGDPNNRRYNVKLFKTMPNTQISCDISAELDDYLNLMDSWSQLIYFPDFEQQARYLMKALPLDMLAQAWSDAEGYMSFVTEDMARTLEQGKAAGWKKRQQRMQAQMNQYQMSMQPTMEFNTKPKASEEISLDEPAKPQVKESDDIEIEDIPSFKPSNKPSAIPGFGQNKGYAPVPPNYSNMMDEIPLEDEEDDDDDDDDGLTDNRVRL